MPVVLARTEGSFSVRPGSGVSIRAFGPAVEMVPVE